MKKLINADDNIYCNLTLVKYMKDYRNSILDGRHCVLEFNPNLRFILTGENNSINNFIAAISSYP